MINLSPIVFFIAFGIRWSKAELQFISNRTSNNFNIDLLPEITYGEKCIPNKIYRMACNTCRCGNKNALFCTKMACLQEEDIRKLKEQAEKGSDKYLRKMKSDNKKYPEIPKGPCVPGKIYKSPKDNCNFCYCSSDSKIIGCSEKTCLKKPKNKNRQLEIHSPLDIRPAFCTEELENMAVLPHICVKCTPGHHYKVDCNVCACLQNGNLLCTKKLCVSSDDYNKLQARMKTGLSCDNDKENNDCIKCKCEKDKLQCVAILGCSPSNIFHNKKRSVKLSMDIKKDKCIPEMVYRDNCNKCYCQKDGQMRCTNKICLNYSQHLAVVKHRKYLEKHGL